MQPHQYVTHTTPIFSVPPSPLSSSTPIFEPDYYSPITVQPYQPLFRFTYSPISLKPPSSLFPNHPHFPITPSFDSPFFHPSFAHLSHFYNTPFLSSHTTTITSYLPYFPIISLPAHYSHITSISSSSPIFHHSISLISHYHQSSTSPNNPISTSPLFHPHHPIL